MLLRLRRVDGTEGGDYFNSFAIRERARFNSRPPRAMHSAVSTAASASHIGVKRHLNMNQHELEEESKHDTDRMEIDEEMKNDDQSESVTQRQSKRLKATTDEEADEGLECIICKEEFTEPSPSQTAANRRVARVLPCMDQLCHSCIVALIDRKGSKNTIKCEQCQEEQPLYQHPEGRTDSDSLARLYKTRQQFAADFKRLESTMLKKKKKRIHDVNTAISELGRIKKSWKDDNQSRQIGNCTVEIDTIFDTQEGRLTQWKQLIGQWEQDLQLQREQFNKSSNQFHQLSISLPKLVRAKEEEIARAQRLSCMCSEVEFQRLINLAQIDRTATDLKFTSKQIQMLPQEYPSPDSGRQLMGSSILPSLDKSARQRLEKYLKSSVQSAFGPLSFTTLLYKASLHGWTKNDFIRRCLGKSHTLMLVKVAGNGYVFGAYIEPKITMQKGGVPDPSNKSFLFSLVNQSNTPLRLSLTNGDSAVNLSTFSYVAFAYNTIRSSNFGLFCEGKPANHPLGNFTTQANEPYNRTYTYQLDEKSHPLPLGFKFDANTFAGSSEFGASEIEIYQL